MERKYDYLIKITFGRTKTVIYVTMGHSKISTLSMDMVPTLLVPSNVI
jgi:hypothetical protein